MASARAPVQSCAECTVQNSSVASARAPVQYTVQYTVQCLPGLLYRTLVNVLYTTIVEFTAHNSGRTYSI